MATVQVEVVLEVSARRAWEAVADVGAVHRRLLPGRVLDARIEGDTRILTMPGGTEIREWIVSVDHELRRLAYAVAGGQQMALIYHHASFQVFAETGAGTGMGAEVGAEAGAEVAGKRKAGAGAAAKAGAGRSRLVWTTDVLPHEAAAGVRARVERGIAEMKGVIEGGGA